MLKNKKVTILDYNAGNILSVKRAFEYCGANVQIKNKPKDIKNSSYLVLPGDGAFGHASKKLEELGIFNKIKEFAKTGKPILGICLGMQLLLSKSSEFGNHKGLSIIKGKNILIPKNTFLRFKLPSVGWNAIKFNLNKNNLTNIYKNSHKRPFYFTHSFYAVPEDKTKILAHYKYFKKDITAIIGHENIVGTQFHPEKSGLDGIKLLKNFLRI
jgi:imidazole glycerol-phosphate synthase subunit HisH|tara:strand:- start:2350 stop:2988 length:639 start_codon:yes stop_codon:yes gene_type:complete